MIDKNKEVVTQEVWFDIKETDLKSDFQVSNYGNVRNKNTKHIFTQRKRTTKFPYVVLRTHEGKEVGIKVDYLVAKWVVGNPNNLATYKHVDGNVENNKSSNLIWTNVCDDAQYKTDISLKDEVWKPILGYEELYAVSNYGRIKHLAVAKTTKLNRVPKIREEKIINPTKNDAGYLIVALRKEGSNTSKTFRVHRLVAEGFINNSEQKPYVDHIDRNRQNNRVSNLRWATIEENNANGNSDAVLCIYPDGKTDIFSSINEASRSLSLDVQTIRSLCNRKGSKSKKNNLECQWANEKTKKSKLAKKNKSKGNGFELEIVNKLKELGFNCVTSRSQSKRTDDDKIDIMDLDNILPINLQTKHTANCPNYFDIRDKCTDKTKPFGIVWKKSAEAGHNSKGTVVTIPVDFFYELLKTYCKL